jgi:hypothetical protein
MDSPSSPKAVDPYLQADAQFGLNRKTALLGNQLAKTDSYSPTESTTWSSSIDPQDQKNYDDQMERYQQNMTEWQTARDRWTANPTERVFVPDPMGRGSGSYQNRPGRGGVFSLAMPEAPSAPIASKWTSRTQLTPDQQRLFDLREDAQGTLLNQANENIRAPLNFSKLDKQVSNLGLSNDFSGERQRVEDALYNRSKSRLDPQFEIGQRDLETKLYNQGVQPGTEAWNRELGILAQQKQDAYSGARTDAISEGGAEQSRLYGMDYQTANQNAALQNQSRQQGLNELFALRQTPLQELQLLQGGGTAGAGAAGGARGGGGQAVANTDIGGAFASDLAAQQAGYQGKVATNNANTSAAASTIAAIVSAAAI